MELDIGDQSVQHIRDRLLADRIGDIGDLVDQPNEGAMVGIHDLRADAHILRPF